MQFSLQKGGKKLPNISARLIYPYCGENSQTTNKISRSLCNFAHGIMRLDLIFRLRSNPDLQQQPAKFVTNFLEQQTIHARNMNNQLAG